MLDKDSHESLDIKIKPNYKFSDGENKTIQAAVEEVTLTATKERREKQKEAILSYIDNALNAGKKLQNIMVEESEKIKTIMP